MTWLNPGDKDPDGLPDWIGLWQPRRCNCRIWAAVMQGRYGGSVCHRQSVVGWRWRRNGRHHEAFWHHAVWTLDHKVYWEYTTTEDKPEYLLWWQLFRMLLFKGRAVSVHRSAI